MHNYHHEIPAFKQETIENIILRILYEERFVVSVSVLADKVLDKAIEQKLTISEKDVNFIIHEMGHEKKIEFSQAKGWHIKI